LTPEFSLVAACCQWPASEAQIDAIRNTARANIDWNHFLRVVMRHRVAPLVHVALGGLEITPPEIAGKLKEFSARIADQSQSLAGESARLHMLFDKAGIPIVFFKGATLAMLAYWALDLKHGRDIDLLIDPDSVQRGIAVLRIAGYEPVHAIPAAPALFRKWISTAKDFEFIHRTRRIVVELHWSLVQNVFQSAQFRKYACTREVRIAEGVSLPTLSDEGLFVYLCVHGARHGWFRLKWLADLSAFLTHLGKDNLDRAIGLSVQWRMEPCVAQALMLCETLLGSEIAASAAARFRKRVRYRVLERVALRMMTRGNAETEVRDIAFGNFPVLLSCFLLGRGWRFILAELHMRLTNLQDMQRFPLPRGLWVLYPILRLPLFVLRRIKDRGIGIG
jgi:hypothetical protein